MSIETFFEKHPADKYFAHEVSFERHENKSPVIFMADILIKEGHAGLETLGPSIIDARDTNNEYAKRQLVDPYMRNATAIYVGVGLKAIEGILAKASFDPSEFNAWMVMAHTGTCIIPETIETQKEEKLTPEEMSIITKVAMSDRTFAFFFREGLNVLPTSIKDFFKNSEILSELRLLILPEYEERVRFLIEANRAKTH